MCKMNLHQEANRVRLQRVYDEIRPVCESVMAQPTPANIDEYIARTSTLPTDVVQEFQQYLLFPFITYIGTKEIIAKKELQMKLVEAVRNILERVTVNSFEMLLRSDVALLRILFADEEPGKLADNVSEELKLSVVKTLTQLQLSLESSLRMKMLKEKVALLAQIVYVSVQYAKEERLRPLRLASINCALAHTMLHPKLTDDKYQLLDPSYEIHLVDMIGRILPGVMSGLQEVANCKNNPGHAIVVATLEAIHRILCLTMNDKFLDKDRELTEKDFAKMAHLKIDVIKKVRPKPEGKNIEKRTPEWFDMAGDKLLVITKSLVELRLHEHFKVRRELGVYCARVLIECNATMHRSIGLCLDVLFALSKDENPKVSKYCQEAVRKYFDSKPDANWHRTMDHLCENFFSVMNCLPRILNNIDSSRKVSALDMVSEYLSVLCAGQRLAAALGCNARAACHALAHAAMLLPHATDATTLPAGAEPWAVLQHLDTRACVSRFQQICQQLGNSSAVQIILDELLDMFQTAREPQVLYVINYIVSAPQCPPHVVQRVLEMYIQEEVWYMPTVVDSGDTPLTNEDTFDPTVYNPKEWAVERVPDLFEGTVSTRYTDICLCSPRLPRMRLAHTTATAAEARNNLLLSCLLTQGVGIMAETLGDGYQKYMLRTLCMVLERVGSKHLLLSMAGVSALTRMSTASEHASIAELIQHNADYITYQVTVRLKKEWNSQSALQILSVVMEYSDATILDCLYDIVQNVLIQSCDKYYEKDLSSYLTVFLTFIKCLRKWYSIDYDAEKSDKKKTNTEVDIVNDLLEFIKNSEEAERLLSDVEAEREIGKSAEEMYREDVEKAEEGALDYDDKVTEVKPPLPRHVQVTVTLLKRSINFITSRQNDEPILAINILNQGLPILKDYEDELLPLIHSCWSGLASRFEVCDVTVLRRAIVLLVTIADLAGEFVRDRLVNDVLPFLVSYLEGAASSSLLQDRGSSYRCSAAFELQLGALSALAALPVRLNTPRAAPRAAADAATLYLSRKQPKPLQILAVNFFKMLLEYDYGIAWFHLREFCSNDTPLKPPNTPIPMNTITGSPNITKNKDYENNIKLIFDLTS